MKIDPRVLIRRLASRLGTLDEILQNWRDYLLAVDEDEPEADEYERALHQFTNVGSLIYLAQEMAGEVLIGKRRHRVLMALHLVDVDLQRIVDDIHDNKDKAAVVSLMLAAGRNARNLVGRRLALAEADSLAWNFTTRKRPIIGESPQREHKATDDNNRSVPPCEIMERATRQQERMLECLWNKPAMRKTEFVNTCWVKSVTDDAIDKAVNRFNEKFLNSGYVIGFSGSQVVFTRPTK